MATVRSSWRRTCWTRQLVDRARASGLQLTGEGRLLQQLTKRVLESDVGPVEFEVPRDREGSFDPQIVKKRRLTGVDEMVLSLSARGLTHGDISAHLDPAEWEVVC